MYEEEYEPIVTIKELESNEKTSSPVYRMFNDLMASTFHGHEDIKHEMMKKYLTNDRSILDKYLVKADNGKYMVLADSILDSRNKCVGNFPGGLSEEKIKKLVNEQVPTLDYQVNLLNGCANHREFIIKVLELRLSREKELRREYNNDIYDEIINYLIDKIGEREDRPYWEE